VLRLARVSTRSLRPAWMNDLQRKAWSCSLSWLTEWLYRAKVLLEYMVDVVVIEIFTAFYGTECSLPCSQQHFNEPCLELDESGPPSNNSYVLRRIWPFARQRLGKHCLKTGLATEAEIHLLGNGSLVSATKDNRPKHELFGVVAAIRSSPCGGGIEYLHRDPASRRRRRKGKSQIWDSKIWSRVPRDSDPRKTALARASKDRPVLLLERAPHKTRP
jgi:hypothetical protein